MFAMNMLLRMMFRLIVKNLCLLFPCKSFTLSSMPQLLLGCSVIEFVNSTEYLGVYIDSRLWHDHDLCRQVKAI